jgi:phosphate transport system permease protein
MMASLPSVVLGFIAALILAPLFETWIGSVVLAAFLIPTSWLLAAFLWQMLPSPVALRYGGWPKFALMFAVLFIATNLAEIIAPAFEAYFFAGDFKAWVNGSTGSSQPFTALLLLPIVMGLLYFAMSRGLPAWLRTIVRSPNRVVAGTAELIRWIATLVVSWFLSWFLAQLLIAVGLDPRGGFLDTYAQRNTLIVGFAMGFAVIPIIYTIAEDALNAVPEHLRGASLGCGATAWQTATMVILPTAMSGVFAGIMVGMGRAVGETMIVVMAAGNTPVMDWNLFNGLRALSANIAVELPEAVKDGTLYRMLFLAALTLFAVTFIVNTLAEIVRQRFRKRAAQL